MTHSEHDEGLLARATAVPEPSPDLSDELPLVPGRTWPNDDPWRIVQEEEARNDPDAWWRDHCCLALVAHYMGQKGLTVEGVVAMLNEPWKFDNLYKAALADLRDSIRAGEIGG